jgi:hypothetical protein
MSFLEAIFVDAISGIQKNDKATFQVWASLH